MRGLRPACQAASNESQTRSISCRMPSGVNSADIGALMVKANLDPPGVFLAPYVQRSMPSGLNWTSAGSPMQIVFFLTSLCNRNGGFEIVIVTVLWMWSAGERLSPFQRISNSPVDILQPLQESE